MPPIYRKYSAHYIITSVLLGYDLWQHREKYNPSRKDWSVYVQTMGVDVKRAGILIRMASKLYRNPITDRKRLDEIAALRIHWGPLVGACADSVTDDQRNEFFDAIARRGHPETLSEDEAWQILKSIAHPIKQSELPLSLSSEPGVASQAVRNEVIDTLERLAKQTLSSLECIALSQRLAVTQ